MESTTQRQQWPAVRQQCSATALAQHGQALHFSPRFSRLSPAERGLMLVRAVTIMDEFPSRLRKCNISGKAVPPRQPAVRD